jgi:hypothetical protein
MFELRVSTELNVAEVQRAIERATMQPLLKCGALVEGEAKRLLSQGTRGIGTPEHGDKHAPRTFTSSAPGQPPHIRTGNLRASIQYAQTDEQTVVVGPTTTAWYGRVLEFGALIQVTKRMRGFLAWAFGWNLRADTTQIEIQKRPFMRPALDNCLSKFPEQFRDLPIGGTIK